MVSADIIGVYNHPHYKDVYIVEMSIDESPSLIDFSLFYCIDSKRPESEWQTAFNEYFLSLDGECIISDGINRYNIPGNTSRVIFGLYAEDLNVPLSTPYGHFNLSSPKGLPHRLKNAALNICLD